MKKVTLLALVCGSAFADGDTLLNNAHETHEFTQEAHALLNEAQQQSFKDTWEVYKEHLRSFGTINNKLLDEIFGEMVEAQDKKRFFDYYGAIEEISMRYTGSTHAFVNFAACYNPEVGYILDDSRHILPLYTPLLRTAQRQDLRRTYEAYKEHLKGLGMRNFRPFDDAFRILVDAEDKEILRDYFRTIEELSRSFSDSSDGFATFATHHNPEVGRIIADLNVG